MTDRSQHRSALRRQGHAHDRAAPRHRARAGGCRRPSRRRGALPALRQGRRPNISISTVYRTVKLFEDAGIIERHDFREGRARYEQIPESHHDHLINLRTGEVIEFQSEEIERLQAEVARKLGYKLVDHRLELYAVPLDDKKNSADPEKWDPVFGKDHPPRETLMVRALVTAVIFFTVTPVLISIQWLLDKLGLPGWGFIASNYYRVLCWIAGPARARGRRAGARPRGAAASPIMSPGSTSW